MASRKYQQVLRAEAAEQTRRRILEAVGRCLREVPTEQPSLGRVAELAKVSRSTIYADFGSRSGLFDAFVADLWERTGLGELGRAVDAADARDHLREGIRAASRMKGQELAVYRVLHAMDRLDPESAGGAVRHMEIDRRAGMQSLAEHLEREGELREGLTVEEAVDALWVLTSFESLDLLVTGRSHTVDEAIDILVDMAERAVCRTPDTPAARSRGA
ncbi:TetR/AcrR family transcriptional regulator [Actinomadura rudentiformis]|uniref:TetR/AcrR family transcriptional regulator n=1 Tax=Actinomadura rudentiformis TaxID=359158 RepID=A0A6H9Z001_9ACTN|nr:TetR/AcrR family transcriptional regulator [Actinomadura rudentiformis]KAB2348459.1 TetR/AcrR family transcriptional regulator [Actinomadura rudentiformis]